MLKYINYQLNPDDKIQAELEHQLSRQMTRCIQNNLSAFRRYQPEVLELLQQHQIGNYSLFCSVTQQLNIVNPTTGRVIYNESPQLEVLDEVQQFIANAPFFSLETQETEVAVGWTTEPLPEVVDVVVVFGLGLGHQLAALLQNCRINYLVVYEPEPDMLYCSVQAIDWLKIFELAESLGTQLSLQIGNDGSSINADLQELQSIVPRLDKVYLYRHLCYPVMDDVIRFLFSYSGDAVKLTKVGQQYLGFGDSVDYLPEHPTGVLGNKIPDTTVTIMQQELFVRNLNAFSHYYPELYQVLKLHKPLTWQLVQYEGEVNLFHKTRNAVFYQNLENDSETMLQNFIKSPYKDDVVVGQAVSRKFKDFVHFRHIEKLQSVFLAFQTEKIKLPEHVDSLIVFGVALGRHVEILLQKRDITNLYICEPNVDFFYASLHTTDWAAIFELANQEKRRIYLNIGGDGSEYFNDFMLQFYQVGAYAIANTYMLPTYYTPELLNAIRTLRNQLRIVLAMGEFYDHARYGISHTYLSFIHQHKFLKEDQLQYSRHQVLDVPVFIVGNGPSLDQSVDYIRMYRDKVLVISCGTALKSLYQLGIRPDFHAEVEQSRATYDWITQIPDRNYLSQIRLLSVNGIHPDTAGLFHEVYLAFKDGESSTQVFRSALAQHNIKVASLSYAYPTVSNLVVNSILKLGFKRLYLFGIDMGYSDIRKHHSQYSAYYDEQGKERFDYAIACGEGTPVKGNFQTFVFTKPEFDVSRRLIEIAIRNHKGRAEIYNCSNGALIKGAGALLPENILLLDTPEHPQSLLTDFLSLAYFTEDFSDTARGIMDSYPAAYTENSIRKYIEMLELEDAVTNYTEAKRLIDKQWAYIRTLASEKANLSFYLLFGSANYMLSVLMKTLPDLESEIKADSLETFNKALAVWRSYLEDILDDFLDEPIKYDQVDVSCLFS